MTVTVREVIVWSTSFLVFDAARTVRELLERLQTSQERYVLLTRYRSQYLYAYRREELLEDLKGARPAASVERELGMHEHESSPQVEAADEISSSLVAGAPAPHKRFVRVDRRGKPLEVGDWSAPSAPAQPRPAMPPAYDPGWTRSAPPPPAAEPPPSRSRNGHGEEPRATVTRGGGAAARPAEGVNIVRHPSITASGTLKPGAPVAITVDLLLEKTDLETESSGVKVSNLPLDWTEVPVQVQLQSTGLTFPDGGDTGAVVIRRDKASIACTLPCTVNADVAPDAEIEVVATFLHGGRFSGFARRVFNRARARTTGKTDGTVSLELGAAAPDLTVSIFHPARSAEGCFAWHVRPRETFPGLPGRLQGEIDLGKRADEYARSLFERCAELHPGKHMDTLEGLGEALWDRAPECFRSVYWAMRKEYGDSFSIQFVSDDPYIPWELMRPYRDGEALELLAAKHPVARWIAAYEGELRNRLPIGKIVTIAPNYSGNINPLPGAQGEAGGLEVMFSATRLRGTRGVVLGMLHKGLENDEVAVVHFAGHGEFGIDFADRSNITLEDGSLSVSEVSNQRVKLGERFRTLVIFNACEIGATASVLGMVGGWAEAFTRRKFSGFVAPLWAVRDQDAAKVTAELLEAVWQNHETMGSALKNIRANYGAESPTFFSYLFYGDVMARVPEA